MDDMLTDSAHSGGQAAEVAPKSTHIEVDISASMVQDHGRVTGIEVGAIHGPVTIHVTGRMGDQTGSDISDLLLDLSPLPALPLPREPFRYLAPYGRADAAIFFGRNRDIRRQYERITAPDMDPIVLLFGQSGAGKSSLLDAGLLPRLERDYQVVYRRRDPSLGLAGTLRAALSQPAADHGAGLDTLWHAAELQGGKPLIVILDQLEEVETRPGAAPAAEVEAFLAFLHALFADPARRPRGRLVLGFRAEYLFKVKKWLDAAGLPYNDKGLLEPLDRAGVMEVVHGPASTPALQRKYGLMVTSGLPARIADDLVDDAGSPVAPTLQVLLSEMWREAAHADPAAPAFSNDLYSAWQRNRRLDDFLKRQLDALAHERPQVVQDGLALDLLEFHVTEQLTAGQRTRQEIEARYPHRPEIWPELVLPLRDKYLLADPPNVRADSPEALRLAHDTLAPLVQAQFNNANAPGRQARRILEGRAPDWEGGKAGAPLDAADLKRVEGGATGMRAWNEVEKQLVKTSLEQRARGRRQQRLVTVAFTTLVLVTLAFWQGPAMNAWFVAKQVAKQSQMVRVDDILEIDRFEVSVALYKRCFGVNECTAPTPYEAYDDPEQQDHPIVNIGADQASAYCTWLGRRLPSLAEWETATLRFHADDLGPSPDRRIIYGSGLNIGPGSTGTWSVMQGAGSDTTKSDRALHLIGNVWEWTCTPKQGPAGLCSPADSFAAALVFVGGGHEMHRPDLMLAQLRSPSGPFESSVERGFRCARTPGKH